MNNIILISVVFFLSQGGFAMTPFTGDSVVLREFLEGKHEVWKTLSGPIGSIEIVSKTDPVHMSGSPSHRQNFKIQVKTLRMNSSIPSAPPDFPACLAVFDVDTEWDFMVIKKMTVKKTSLDCAK
jgi:hypothetical protein